MRKLHTTDPKDLYEFEIENRIFLETMVPTRGDNYYKPKIFKKHHDSLLEEQAKGDSYFYLIKDQNGSILRINLVDIEKTQNIGKLGYRVGRAYTGKGVATKALKQLFKTELAQSLKQINA